MEKKGSKNSLHYYERLKERGVEYELRGHLISEFCWLENHIDGFVYFSLQKDWMEEDIQFQLADLVLKDIFLSLPFSRKIQLVSKLLQAPYFSKALHNLSTNQYLMDDGFVNEMQLNERSGEALCNYVTGKLTEVNQVRNVVAHHVFFDKDEFPDLEQDDYKSKLRFIASKPSEITWKDITAEKLISTTNSINLLTLFFEVFISNFGRIKPD